MHILDLVWSRYDHFSGRYCENKNFGFSVTLTLTLTFDLDSPKTTSVEVGPWPTSVPSLVMIAETVWLLQGKQTHKQQTDRDRGRPACETPEWRFVAGPRFEPKPNSWETIMQFNCPAQTKLSTAVVAPSSYSQCTSFFSSFVCSTCLCLGVEERTQLCRWCPAVD